MARISLVPQIHGDPTPLRFRSIRRGRFQSFFQSDVVICRLGKYEKQRSGRLECISASIWRLRCGRQAAAPATHATGSAILLASTPADDHDQTPKLAISVGFATKPGELS
jgi:hypothetical protein